MSDTAYEYDLAVLGAGPGGYVAAIRASQLGLKAVVIEKDKPGGICGNWGCIPSKALISQAEVFHSIGALETLGVKVDKSGFDYSVAQKKSRGAAERSIRGATGLLRKNKVTIVAGTGTITGPHEITVQENAKEGSPAPEKRAIKAKYLLIATGSRPRQLPGFEFDEDQVLSSTGILSLTSLPKSLLILGSGAIGMEFAYVMNAFGVEVTVIEMLPRILPVEDHETAAVVEKAFKGRGVKFLVGTKAQSLAKSKSGVSLEVEGADGKKETLKADKILVAVGRVPNTDGIGLETLGVKTDRGFVVCGDYYETSVPGIFAIGDITPSPLLAHVASKEGEIAVEHMAGHDPGMKKIDPLSIPGATYCEPQIASFGLTEEKAKEKGLAYKTFSFPYLANGKANAIERPEGLVKIVYDEKTKEILGGHAVGYTATEIIHELLLARTAELLPEDIATMIHAHPTISEAVMESARGVEGWAIHI